MNVGEWGRMRGGAGWLSRGGGGAVLRSMLGGGERGRLEGSRGHGGSGLGHGAGLLVVDVAAHAAGVHAWRDHRGGSRGQGAGLSLGDGWRLKVVKYLGKCEKAQQKQERSRNVWKPRGAQQSPSRPHALMHTHTPCQC